MTLATVRDEWVVRKKYIVLFLEIFWIVNNTKCIASKSQVNVWLRQTKDLLLIL